MVKSLVKRIIFLIKFWVPPLLWACVIFALSSKPTGTTAKIDWQDFVVKKTAHVVFYGLFATLLYRALKSSKIKQKNAGLFSIFLATVYGVTDEIHQSFTPGREPRVRDVFFDTIGAIAAIYIIWNLLPKAPEKLKNLAKNLQII